jgi:hypothetical protein
MCLNDPRWHNGEFSKLKKSIEIVVFLTLNIGFMLYAQASIRNRYHEWQGQLSIGEWLDTFALPLLLALENLAIYFVFREKRT